MAPVHVPEYSAALPETVALHAPFHDCADLLADHPPCIRILPVASWSTHVPIALPSSGVCAVQAPAKYLLLVDALQVPRNSAPEARIAKPARVARTAANILLNLAQHS
jgi:hypothetical protein